MHDCRVALRRLRVAMKAYGPNLKPGVPKDLRKAVSLLAEQTGPARDSEVFIEWLEGKRSRLPVAWRATAEWLLAREIARRESLYRKLRRLIPKVLALIEPLLRAGLAIPAGSANRGTFGALTARCVDEQVEELGEALGKIRDAEDEDRAHRARIAAKKVRYLLEPALTERGSAILKPLKTFQDRLGAFHDLAEAKAHLQAAVRSVRASAHAPSGDPVAAVRGILVRAERERLLLFGQIRTEYLATKQTWLQPVIRWTRRNRGEKPTSPLPAAPRAHR